MEYNYEAYYTKVADMLSDPNKTISEIFNESEQFEPIYKKILLDGVLKLIASSNSNKPLKEETKYFWNQFSTNNNSEGFFKDALIILKCVDAKTPFSSVEKGDILELGKMYIWYSKDPNISYYGDTATTIWHSDFSYAGEYCLARFESLYRIHNYDFPQQLLDKIYNK